MWNGRTRVRGRCEHLNRFVPQSSGFQAATQVARRKPCNTCRLPHANRTRRLKRGAFESPSHPNRSIARVSWWRQPTTKQSRGSRHRISSSSTVGIRNICGRRGGIRSGNRQRKDSRARHILFAIAIFRTRLFKQSLRRFRVSGLAAWTPKECATTPTSLDASRAAIQQLAAG